jgi:hypothetical protein
MTIEMLMAPTVCLFGFIEGISWRTQYPSRRRRAIVMASHVAPSEEVAR